MNRPTRRLPRETAEQRSQRTARVVRRLRRLYADADCALHHDNVLQLLVATILSAQCTDERVNQVTPALFRRYPTAGDYARADPQELEQLIRATGFFRNKAKSLIGLGRCLVDRHAGEVPADLKRLVELPGVGRKTANVVLGTWFAVPGITVDTHVKRLAGRLGLTAETDPVRIEFALMELLPEQQWTFVSHALIWHGRRVCHARKPACGTCALVPDCPWPAQGH